TRSARTRARAPACARRRRRRRAHDRAPGGLARGDLPGDHGEPDGMRFPSLVENEMLKIAKQRRFRGVVLILVALIGLLVYGSFRARERFHAKDWHVEAEERMAWLQGRIRDSRTPPTALRWFRFELGRLQYHLDRDLDPDAISGPIFARAFANHASYLLLPL